MQYSEEFLRQLDEQKNRVTYARITALQLNETPIETIEGRVTQGSISVDGSSAVRRTCSLTMVAQDVNINEYYWGYKTKFKLAIGLQNTIEPNYPDIIWFEQGIFVITSFSCSVSTNNYTINLQGKDKMCLLNGEVGGAIAAPTVFDSWEEMNDDGDWVIQKYPIKDIIRDSVHEYGGEPFHNIIINDLDEMGLELLEYRYDDPMFLFRSVNDDLYVNGVFDPNMPCWLMDGTQTTIGAKDSEGNYLLNYDSLLTSMVPLEEPTKIRLEPGGEVLCMAKIDYGETAGYRLTELTYPDDLIGNVGEALTSILDKIKNILGDFEYFYDIDGRFIFQRKKNYINTVWTPEIDVEDGASYIDGMAYSDAITYAFNGSELVSAFNNSPALNNLRNDFSVWGARPGINEDIPIHMRYAIDQKPQYYKSYSGQVYVVDPSLLGYNKQPLPAGLDDDWWEVRDWANYYKILTGEYPTGVLELYKTETTSLDLEALFPGGVSWDKNRTNLSIFDVNPDGSLRYTGHNPTCSHTYSWFVDQANQQGISTYFYKPTIPDSVITTDKYDWREIIFQMQKDYRKHHRDDDYALQIKANNPGYYPEGRTGYEQYYVDIEGFWRDLYYTKEAFQEYCDKIEIKIENVATNILNLTNNIAANIGDKESQEKLLESFKIKKNELEKHLETFIEDWNTNYYPEDDERRFWNRKVYENPALLNFWFDFLDSDGELNQYSVKMIGSRPKAINDSNVKSIYFRDTPAIIFATAAEMDLIERDPGYRYFQISKVDSLNMFSISAQGKSAKDEIDVLLYNHSYTTESVTITCIPIYYLQPNTRILVHDDDTGINGEYIISKMNIPLSYNGTMSINATKAPMNLI